MHSCLSLSLLHHLEGGFCLISLCSKIFPAFLSSVLGKKKKKHNKKQKQTHEFNKAQENIFLLCISLTLVIFT